MTERIFDVPDFSVEVSAAGDGLVHVIVVGEVDIASTPRLVEAVGEQIGPVRLDLRAVTFLDSSGVRALNALAREQPDLTICRELGGNVAQVLELTGMMELLPLTDCGPL